MRRASLFLAAALAVGAAGVAGASAPHWGREAVGVLVMVTATNPGKPLAFTVTRVEPVERELYGAGVRLFTTFLTVYQINGRPVSAGQFWATAKAGRRAQAKTHPRAGLTWAARINLQTP